MKRKFYVFIALIVLASCSVSAIAATPSQESDYDPQHTILALNTAIVAIHNIVTTQDRIVLDQEYNTIINKLALGNIESDYELTALFTEMMNFITGKTLRQEEAKRFQERYNRREQRQLIDALSGIRAYGGNLWSWLGSLATSCVSSYFTYQNSKAELLEGLNDELWQLKKEDVMDCNDLQVRLLNASWNLLRQYKLPDEYRLTQDSLDGFFKAVNETDPEKRFRMLKARNVERNFQSYPPYWVYRAMTAQELKNDEETSKCYDKFDEIWRPVLRYDPYKLEAEKYRVQALAAKENPDKKAIKEHLEIVRDYTPDDDWGNNIFAGVTYFLLGENEEGISCVEPNIDFEYEQEISELVLAQMKKGKLDLALIPDELKALEKKALRHMPMATPVQKKQQKPKETKQVLSKQKGLTRADIERITKKHGFKIENKLSDSSYSAGYGVPIGKYVISSVTSDGGLFGTWHSVHFCDDRFYWREGFVFNTKESMSYEELREKTTDAQIRQLFKGFPSIVIPALMELKEFK